ncbi:MAG TPA: alpha/beta fold hydrolase [Thermoanaerobaculia bacterium]|nr:alpha/beta fold hydrolase [Thermoanaerobaculia bacterium]
MTKMLLALLLGLPGAVSAETYSLLGHWEGAVARLGSVQPIQVDFREQGGKLSATVDCPERSLAGMPAETVEYNPPTLRLKFLYGDATLRVDAETEEITGVIPAWQPEVRVHLKRAEAPAVDFLEEEVHFASGTLSLTGNLVQPITKGPHPALVLVQGSAWNTRTEPRYRSQAVFFARHGFAALIYDKRPGFENATFSDLADDAAAAVRYLKTRKDVDVRHVGLAGYSQGGWLAPLAASRVEGVAYLVLHVAPAVSVEEQEIQHVRYGMAADGFSEEDVARAAAYTRKVFDVAYRGADWAGLAVATEKAKGTKWAEQVQLATTPADLEGWRHQRYDPAETLRRTTVPVLALYGAIDTLVPPAENAELMRRFLTEAGNRDVTIRIFPRASHNLEWFGDLRTGTWSWPEGYWVWAKRAPGYADTVVGWLRAHLDPP